ncbi:MAG: hypothetical protein HKL96_08650 [Phycisphaerales bacterium]|nr:hypothetical protein [Phycisphaerales bacterium]
MNAAEQIVDQYLQLCLRCFTIADVKVVRGNNRQLDLLAINPKQNTQYHIEVSVTHDLGFAPDANKLYAEFDRKFRGVPPARDGHKTDHSKGKNYLANIEQTYKQAGLEPSKIKRVYCCWFAKEGAGSIDTERYFKDTGLKIEIWSLRDDILPDLLETIGTTNYDHPILRTLSLLKQHNKQNKKTREQE